MERMRSTRFLVISALACFMLFLMVGAARAGVVQNQNSSSGGFAQSGDARVTNVAVVNAGPSASSSGGPAQASQIGSNHVVVDQTGVAKSGDAVVNSQITGIVGGGNNTVQNQNSGIGGLAISGDADVSNTAFVNVGPFAGTSLVSPTAAQASQIGNNEAVISQSAEAITGDAIVNSQVTGIVGGWDSTVQGQNNAFGGLATSGAAGAGNALLGSGLGPIATGGTGLASQNGSNFSDIAQAAQSGSGDSVSGSQVSGSVGDLVGFHAVRESHAGF